MLKSNNTQLSRDLEDVTLKLDLLVADATRTDAEEKEAFVREEMTKQVSLARTQRDEAVSRLHQLQDSNLALKSKLEEVEEVKRELETRLVMAQSALETCQSESSHLREMMSRNARDVFSSPNNSSSSNNSSFSNNPSSNNPSHSSAAAPSTAPHSSSTTSPPYYSSSSSSDLALIEALKLEIDELRAMKPMIEVLKRDAEKLPNLERMIDNLKLELTTAQSRRMNEEALQIQVEASVAVQKQMEATIVSLTQQNVKLKEDALVWAQTMETMGADAGRSSDDIKSFIFDLQAENLTLLEKLGACESQLKLSASHLSSAQKRLKEADSAIFQLKTEKTSLQGTIAQKEGKLQLIENEVQGMRALLDSYKLEDGVGGYDAQKTAHISALESTLADRSTYVESLEKDIEALKNELAQLSKHAKRLADDKIILENRVGKGEIDPSRTRILHFSETPLHLMLAKDAKLKSVDLEQKVETLSAQLEAIERQHLLASSAVASSTTSSTVPSNTSSTAPSNTAITAGGVGGGGGAKLIIDSALHVQQEKEMKMLRHQFQETKVAMDRMKSATEVAIRRYMSSVWNVFGWKVDFEEKNRVKVRYKYWNDQVRASQAVLLFEYPSTLGQKGVNDQLEPFTLLDSPYSQHIPADIVDVLKHPNTLPLFIAKLTQHLFEMVASANQAHAR